MKKILLIFVLALFFRAYPVVAEALQNEADAVHLSVGSSAASKRPAEALAPRPEGHNTLERVVVYPTRPTSIRKAAQRVVFFDGSWC